MQTLAAHIDNIQDEAITAWAELLPQYVGTSARATKLKLEAHIATMQTIIEAGKGDAQAAMTEWKANTNGTTEVLRRIDLQIEEAMKMTTA